MNNRDLEQKIQELVQQRKRRKRWYKLTAVLAAAAMVVTAGSLILPAMTMEESAGTSEMPSWISTPMRKAAMAMAESFCADTLISWFTNTTRPAMTRKEC